VVEDSLPGIEAGLAAGMPVFSLLPQFELLADLAERVVCIKNLRDLDAFLHPAN
jgi:beta-phosphoglucomutase-like phosphatase (HAD superfamily)